MADLQAGLEAAISRHGCLFLISGEPGIGKTRLADELAAHASRRGARVLWGRCWEGGGAPPFWPWVKVLRGLIHEAGPPSIRQDIGAGAAYIAQLVPEVRNTLEESSTPQELNAEQARFYLFDAVTSLLKNASARVPLLLVLDDLHWADRPSLMLLAFLARELRDSGILVVGTYRDADVRQRPEAREILGQLVPEAVGVALRGLSDTEVRLLIESRIGKRPSDAFVSAVHEATDGNPFFADEVVRSMVAEGRTEAPGAQLPISEGVRSTIRRSFGTIPDDARNLLSLAAVVGREFDGALLRHACSQRPEVLAALLAKACESGLVAKLPGSSSNRYAFSHALVRETLYEDLEPAKRSELHGKVAEALEDLYATNREPHLAELAHHFREAGAEAEADKAFDYSVRSGHHAMAMLAYEEAARHFEYARATLGASKRADFGELLLALGDAHWKGGDTERAKGAFRDTAELAKGIDHPDILARAALGHAGKWIETGVIDEQTVSLLEQALTSLGDTDTALRATVMSRLAVELYYSESRRRPASLTQRAVEIAERVGDPLALAYAVNARRWALWGPDDTEDPNADAATIIRCASTAGDSELLAWGYTWRIFGSMRRGDRGQLDGDVEACAREAQRVRQLRVSWRATWLQAMRFLIDGRFGEAEKLASEALAIGQSASERDAIHLFGIQVSLQHMLQGRFDELEAPVKAFVDQHPKVPAWRCFLAVLYAELGRIDEARAQFEQFAVGDFALLSRDGQWIIGMDCLSRACSSLQDVPRAATLYELLLPYSAWNVVAGTAVAYWGPVSEPLGLLAATVGRSEEAVEHFERALEMNLRMRARPHLARTQHAYAKMLLAQGAAGDREKATQLTERALATSRELGMKALEKQLLALGLGPEAKIEATRTGAHPSAPAESIFRKEGDYWSIGDEGRVFRLKDTKGLNHIAFLLCHPHCEFHVSDIVAAAEGATAGVQIDALGGAGETLDSQARAAYRSRLEELREQLEEAERHNDLGRAAVARREIDALTQELARAAGLGGRNREGASAADRARQSVTKTIKDALRKIAEYNPALGRHLDASIKTGTFCSYAPSPEQPVVWKL